MIEETDFATPGTAALRNKPGITDSSQFSKVEADLSGFRLLELQCSPIRGSFDAAHLQNIHHYIYQDLYDWAGELRFADDDQGKQSLDRILDSLGADNHLRGLNTHEWAAKVTGYVYELGALQPFVRGNGITLREFVVELASKNQLRLQWNVFACVPAGKDLALLQQAQSGNLRRLIMLALDKDSPPLRPSRGDRPETALERLAGFGSSRV